MQTEPYKNKAEWKPIDTNEIAYELERLQAVRIITALEHNVKQLKELYNLDK